MNKYVILNDLIGKPFVRGARGPNEFDCHGLVIEVFKRYGIDFPDVNIAQMAVEEVTKLLDEKIDYHINVLKDWKRIIEPDPPCLVVIKGDFKFANHLGVCIGDGKFIHSKEGSGVCVERMASPIRRNNLRGFYKYVGSN